MIEIRKQPQVSDAWSKSAYEDIYAGPGIRQTDSFYAWLLKLIRPKPGRRMLDVSCGEGRLAQLAAQMGVVAYGVDLSEAALRIANAESTERRFVLGDAQRLPFADASFDYITNIGSLEHYLDPGQGAREITRLLTPGGLACILLPNTYSLLDNLWYAFRFGRTLEDNQPIQRYASRYEWQDLLEANGLRVERTIKYEREFPTRLADVGFYLRHPKPLIRLLLTPLVPLNLAACLVYLCRRRDDVVNG